MQMGQTDDDGQIGCPESETLVTQLARNSPLRRPAEDLARAITNPDQKAEALIMLAQLRIRESVGLAAAATLDLTTVLTTTVTTFAIPATPPTRPFASHLACSRRLPAPGSPWVRVARRWRRRYLGGTVAGGPAVTVYSPPMTRNRPKLPGCHRGFEIINPVVAQ
jgi:hypothetical protein